MSTSVAASEPRSSARQACQHPGAAVAAALALAVAGLAYLRNTDPRTDARLFPRCPFNCATGLQCPACGATRMAYDLMHGDLRAALRDNAFLLLASPYALTLAARRARPGARGRPNGDVPRARGPLLVLGTAVAWTIVRNCRRHLNQPSPTRNSPTRIRGRAR